LTVTWGETPAAPLTTLGTSTSTVPLDDQLQVSVALNENGHPLLTGQVEVAVVSCLQAGNSVTVNTEL
jgi:hypothetical protein